MLKQYLNALFKQIKKPQGVTAALVILLIACLGTYLLIGSHAATPYTSTTADSGTLANGAVKQSCNGASDGNCVLFGGGSAVQTNCFAHPGACGYPDPAASNVGVGNCSALPNFSFANRPAGTYYSGTGNSLEITGSNVTISNINLGDVSIYVAKGASNFTLNNVCMSVNGGGANGSIVINTAAGSAGLTVENSTISGANGTTEAVGKIIEDLGSGATIKNNYMYNFAGGVFEKGDGTELVQNNYMLLNVTMLQPNGSPVHYEPMYCTNNPALTINHNTLFITQGQTAAIFCNTGDGAGGACSNHVTITDNFMAGGGYTLYPCANSSGVGTSVVDIENNRFAKCLGTPITHQYPNGGSGYTCGTVDGAGADSHGYWPYSGYYGVVDTVANYIGPSETWSGNYWDDTLHTVNPTTTGD